MMDKHPIFKMFDKMRKNTLDTLTLPQIAALAAKHGYVIMPKEPTEALCASFNSGTSQHPDQGIVWNYPFKDGYKAMIEAVAVQPDEPKD